MHTLINEQPSSLVHLTKFLKSCDNQKSVDIEVFTTLKSGCVSSSNHKCGLLFFACISTPASQTAAWLPEKHCVCQMSCCRKVLHLENNVNYKKHDRFLGHFCLNVTKLQRFYYYYLDRTTLRVQS